tara:strand:+ start:2754 stop:3098 length:345 start_codon:yes stop_codon:yes gene_type:complete
MHRHFRLSSYRENSQYVVCRRLKIDIAEDSRDRIRRPPRRYEHKKRLRIVHPPIGIKDQHSTLKASHFDSIKTLNNINSAGSVPACGDQAITAATTLILHCEQFFKPERCPIAR